MIRGKNILITGGAGFIGTHLTKRLIKDNKVVIFDAFYRNALELCSELRGHPNLTIVKGDILDGNYVREVLSKYRPDIITHMASIAGVQTVISQPVRVLSINVIGTHNILKAIVDLKLPIERFIDFSTSEVYGPHVFEANEEAYTTLGPLSQPRWYYAASKLASEYITHGFGIEHKIPAVSIRPFNVYGPYQVGEGAVHNFVKAAIAGEDLVVHNNGNQIRSWCYIDDFIEGVVAAMERPEAVGHAFNIGNPQSTVTNLDIARRIIAETGSSSTVRFKRIEYPDVNLRVPSVEKAERILGFSPKVGIEEGLRRTVAWMSTLKT